MTRSPTAQIIGHEHVLHTSETAGEIRRGRTSSTRMRHSLGLAVVFILSST